MSISNKLENECVQQGEGDDHLKPPPENMFNPRAFMTTTLHVFLAVTERPVDHGGLRRRGLLRR